MSNKSSLKDKIKKPNATQAFFNSYDEDETGDIDSKKGEKKDVENENNNKNDVDKNNINDNDVKSKTYVNEDNVIDVNVEDEDDDYLRNLASGKKALKKKAKKVFTSFYMDPDLAAEIDKIAARGEKGDKSKFINKAIRNLLEEYGVLEKK
ncbi:CopG family transcriptional regulator [Pseudomonas sp. ISL-84]|nr:CopG family transcriptional regulator [Pseudomonas sp. ISL-84]